MSKPAKVHKKAAKHLLHYIILIKNVGLIFEKKFQNIKLFEYTDSNFINDVDNRYSISEYLFKFNKVCIH